VSLRDAGWDVVVVSPRGSKRDVESQATIDGIEIHRFEPAESGGGAVGYLREYALATARIRNIIGRLALTRTFDVVHACNPPDFLLLAARRLRRGGAATIFDHHDLSPELFLAKYRHRFPMHPALLLVERAGFAMADVVLSANESFREAAIERGGKSPDDVFVVRNGPDTTVFEPTDPDPEIKRGAPHLIGYVGLMGNQDGIDIGLESLAALRRRRTDWRAVFVGDGDALPEAQRLTQRLGLEDAVEFLGFVGDRERLVRLIATCDVCISPEPRNQLNEKSTLVKVAEYLAVGRPVVAFDLKETRRTAGDAASYAPRDDAEAFASALDELLGDPDRRARMGALGRARALEIGWDESERALLAAYARASMLARERRARRSR
jgi:glycosyltransferase involved in cell wall biosynthesis